MSGRGRWPETRGRHVAAPRTHGRLHDENHGGKPAPRDSAGPCLSKPTYDAPCSCCTGSVRGCWVPMTTTIPSPRPSRPTRRSSAGTSRAARGRKGKAVVAGVKGRESKRIRAGVVPDRTKADPATAHRGQRDPSATVYTDEAKAYKGIPNPHEWVNHSAGQYEDGMASTDRIEGFWCTLKKAYHGTYHRVSHKHLDRYVGQFTAKHNMRDSGTEDQLEAVIAGMIGRRVRYRDLTRKTAQMKMTTIINPDFSKNSMSYESPSTRRESDPRRSGRDREAPPSTIQLVAFGEPQDRNCPRSDQARFSPVWISSPLELTYLGRHGDPEYQSPATGASYGGPLVFDPPIPVRKVPSCELGDDDECQGQSRQGS